MHITSQSNNVYPARQAVRVGFPCLALLLLLWPAVETWIYSGDISAVTFTEAAASAQQLLGETTRARVVLRATCFLIAASQTKSQHSNESHNPQKDGCRTCEER